MKSITMNLELRQETASDHAAVEEVHRAAFGQKDEARLVNKGWPLPAPWATPRWSY